MKKFFVSVLMLMTAVGAKAQMTAEAIMALMPEMPTLAEMIQYQKDIMDPDKDDPENLYVPFYEALDAAKEKAHEGGQKALGGSIAHKALESRVGKYKARDFQNMSDAQREKAGKEMANDRLKGMGLSDADIARMQSGNLSEAEEQALANKIMKNMTGGMNVKDVQFMQGMTDKERAQFMQQSGLAESGKAKIKENQAKQKKDARMVKEGQDLARYDRQATEIINKIYKQIEDAATAGRELYDSKYRRRLDAIHERSLPWIAKQESGTDKEVKEAGAKLSALGMEAFGIECEFYEKFLPTWRAAVVRGMEICHSELLPLMQEKKIVTDKLYEQTKSAEYAEGAVFPIMAAMDYLDIPDYLDKYDSYLFPEGGGPKHAPDDARQARDTDGNPYDSVEE